MTYKGFEITVVCANNKMSHIYGAHPVYGDIYDDYDQCVKEHPDDEVIYGFFVNDNDGDAPDWFLDIKDAMYWIDDHIALEIKV